MGSYSDIWGGAVIGIIGGAGAGITLMLCEILRNHIIENGDKKKVFKWMKENTKDEYGKRFRSTRSIASHNNLTEDRVRYICSIHDKIYLSTGEKEDMWSVLQRDEGTVYDERGVVAV